MEPPDRPSAKNWRRRLAGRLAGADATPGRAATAHLTGLIRFGRTLGLMVESPSTPEPPAASSRSPLRRTSSRHPDQAQTLRFNSPVPLGEPKRERTSSFARLRRHGSTWKAETRWCARYDPVSSSSTESPMSRVICRRSVGEMSRPGWKGTVVTRPSGWRNCLCEPRCRTSAKPSRSSSATTSRGLRTGAFATVRQPERSECRRIPLP
jgi:hypothetical protein